MAFRAYPCLFRRLWVQDLGFGRLVEMEATELNTGPCACSKTPDATEVSHEGFVVCFEGFGRVCNYTVWFSRLRLRVHERSIRVLLAPNRCSGAGGFGQ